MLASVETTAANYYAHIEEVRDVLEFKSPEIFASPLSVTVAM